MKKLAALILAIGMLASWGAALAAGPTLESYIPIEIPYGEHGMVYNLDLNGHDGSWISFWHENGKWNYDNSGASNGELYYFTDCYDGLMEGKTDVPWALFVAGETFSTIKDAFYASYFENDGNPFVRLFYGNSEKILKEIEKRFLVVADEVKEITWYTNNTVCAAGLEFREEKPAVTDKWYNFVPIDLSIEGKQVFDLVASNMYVVGKVIVNREGDSVTVDWKLNKQGTVDGNFQSKSEFLTFFRNLDEVASVKPADIETSFEFGQPISIANDLDGDTNVLLYVRNVATYCNNLSFQHKNDIFHPRYWRNLKSYVVARDAMRALMQADADQ